MLESVEKNQNWAKITPVLGVLTLILLWVYFKPTELLFWAYINIPLYFFHQAEEHFYPGGFKDYVNHVVNQLPRGEEHLTDKAVFWINILLVWVAFFIFALLALINIGFGLVIIVLV